MLKVKKSKPFSSTDDTHGSKIDLIYEKFKLTSMMGSVPIDSSIHAT